MKGNEGRRISLKEAAKMRNNLVYCVLNSIILKNAVLNNVQIRQYHTYDFHNSVHGHFVDLWLLFHPKTG